MRWGVGAGASRLVSRHMTLHRRLEERLAEFKRTESALLFGSGFLANLGVIGALAPRARSSSPTSSTTPRSSTAAGSRAETFVYDHNDIEHLEWGLRSRGRGSLIVTDGVFSMDGDVAPLADIVDLARRHDVRVMVDEAHGTGCMGPGGRGAVAEAGLEQEVDVIVGTLGKALGSYGAFVACEVLAAYLINTARPLIFSTALPPMAARPRWRRWTCSRSSHGASRSSPTTRTRCATRSPARASRSPARSTQFVPLIVGDARRRCAWASGARARRFRAGDPAADGAGGTSRLRLAVMASHPPLELREAAPCWRAPP